MANPKSERIQFDLSGTRISYASPLNYSKDYPRGPADTQTQYRINIHDLDLYKKHNSYTKNAANFHGIRQSRWDYGRSMIWGSVKGTLSISASLYRTLQPEFDPQDPNAFIKALQADFEQIYDKRARKDYELIAPESYQTKILSGIPWGYYEFSIRGKRIVAYALPLSERHYFKVEFDFINNSEGKINNWKQQAQATVDFIMASFEVK